MVADTSASVLSGLAIAGGDLLSEDGELSEDGDLAARQAAVSAALMSVFRGRFCDVLLPGRKAITFNKNDVIYDLGDRTRTMFFLRNGFVKVGAITSNGQEVIYDVRREGDVYRGPSGGGLSIRVGLGTWRRLHPVSRRLKHAGT